MTILEGIGVDAPKALHMSMWWYLAIAAVIVLLVNVLVVLLFVITGERSAKADDAYLDS